MKATMTILPLILMTNLADAGVGGISGGHINFQRESTFVSPVHSKSLCFDGVDYHAMINKCAEWRSGGDDERCVRYEKVPAVQPRVSTRERCATFAGREEGNCRKYETIPFIQNPVREVSVMQGDQEVKKMKVKVRSCR